MKSWRRFGRFVLGWAMPTSSLFNSVWAAAGAVAQADVASRSGEPAGLDARPLTFENTMMNSGAQDRYAAHSSHSSHSSHRSHSSHYSSSTGGGSSDATIAPSPQPPVESPAAPPAASQGSAPAPAKQSPTAVLTSKPPAVAKTARPSSKELLSITTRVQAALSASGYYVGNISGELNEETRAALRKFQAKKNIPVTGRMDTKTLTALGIKVN